MYHSAHISMCAVLACLFEQQTDQKLRGFFNSDVEEERGKISQQRKSTEVYCDGMCKDSSWDYDLEESREWYSPTNTCTLNAQAR